MRATSSVLTLKWGDLVGTVFRMNALFLALGNEIARPAGQTSSRWFVLAATYFLPRTVPQIARQMGLTRQSVQRTADLLVREGFATFEENDHHRRAKLIALTERGKTAMEAITTEQERWATIWVKQFGERDLFATLDSLHRLEEICRRVTPRARIQKKRGRGNEQSDTSTKRRRHVDVE
jgi:DNA-binding MarR family transcriptional regulator